MVFNGVRIDKDKVENQGQDSQNFLRQLHKIIVILDLKLLKFLRFKEFFDVDILKGRF